MLTTSSYLLLSTTVKFVSWKQRAHKTWKKIRRKHERKFGSILQQVHPGSGKEHKRGKAYFLLNTCYDSPGKPLFPREGIIRSINSQNARAPAHCLCFYMAGLSSGYICILSVLSCSPACGSQGVLCSVLWFCFPFCYDFSYMCVFKDTFKYKGI